MLDVRGHDWRVRNLSKDVPEVTKCVSNENIIIIEPQLVRLIIWAYDHRISRLNPKVFVSLNLYASSYFEFIFKHECSFQLYKL